MIQNKRARKYLTSISVVIAAFFIILQMVDFTGTMRRVRFATLMQFLPTIAKNATLMFVPLVFGAVYGRRKQSEFAEMFRMWLMAVTTLIIFYLAYFIIHPHGFNMWRLWGVFFPVATGTSLILTAILAGLLFKPAIKKWQEKMNQKQNLLVLSFLTLAAFTLSAGTIQFNYSIYGLLLVLEFAWGMYLSQLQITSKIRAWLIAAAVVSFLIVLVGLPGFSGIYWYSVREGAPLNWNREFLTNPTSPFMVIFVNGAYLIFEPIIKSFSRRQLRSLIPAIVIMATPLSSNFVKSFAFTPSSSVNKLIVFAFLVIVTLILAALYQRYLFRGKACIRLITYLSQSNNPVIVLEDVWDHLTKWVMRNHVNLLTWAWFYVLSFASFLVETNNLRIQFITSSNINAITFLLATRFFAIILTAIFLDAAFTILYFVTTRYWLSSILVSVFAIGWAIANKIKLNLRGEPIYPSELSEAVNMKSLLSMVNRNLLIVIGVALVLILALMIYLEIRHPIKKHGTWRRRGIWALLSLLLMLTPMRFNHENSIVHYLSHGFDNKAFFRNPERELQVNGPILNFLNYIDLQAMTKPDNYSQYNVNKVIDKYQTIAKQINKHRKNKLAKQTIVFNLSESFVDPYTFPTIKLKGVANPVKYIQTLKNRSTYGAMISAGYGGGTANMEWESLTGLNMGLFKTTLTPYVQIVPNFKFYPTIGMNFNYSSAIHPFIGTYYSRIEDYQRFKFNKFAYLGSKYKIIDQHHIDQSPYNSDFTAYDNGLKQINARKGGQFINLISMQNHMPYGNWYKNNEYVGKVNGQLFGSGSIKQQMASYIKGIQYTDEAVKQFIGKIDKIKKPITLVFYGDHYPAILPQTLALKYPVQMHSTRYFIYANKYAREHGAKTRLKSRYKYVNTSDFIAMMLQQTNSKVTPYQALLTQIHKQLPAITINFKDEKGFQLVNQKGNIVDPKSLTNEQQTLVKDLEMIQYDMTAGQGYSLRKADFYK